MIERWQSYSGSIKLKNRLPQTVCATSFYCSFLCHLPTIHTITHFSFPAVLAPTNPSFMVYSLFFEGVCQTSEQKVSLVSHTFQISLKNFLDQARSLLEHLNLQLFNFSPSFCSSLSSILKEYLSLQTESFLSHNFELIGTFLGWGFTWNGYEVSLEKRMLKH